MFYLSTVYKLIKIVQSVAYNSNQFSRARLEQHTKIFASMCPDEILDHYNNYETREYHTTLMLGDVSG